VYPLFSNDYIINLQSNRRSFVDIMRAYIQRIILLVKKNKYDLVWIEKELLPWLPSGFEQFFLRYNIPYVLDYDDAVFHYYDQHKLRWVRFLLANKHRQLMRRAALVIAGNQYLADYADSVGAKHVALLPTAIDLERYPTPLPKNAAIPNVGWIGQRSSSHFLYAYSSLFENLASENIAHFSAVGIDTSALNLPMTAIPWKEDTEVESIASFDIGIMPLIDGAFERGKCGYKLIQYMACGLPVIASPVGVNCQIVEHGINGFLAENIEQWDQSLRLLLADKQLRQHMGQAGRNKVEQYYCIQVTHKKLVSLLKQACQNIR
jgi:glycosyltransferase involved in cell wall biosynthesis